MSDQLLLRDSCLANGLRVTVTDVSRHYYGGYWQVALEVSCLVPLEAGLFADTDLTDQARCLLGETVPFVRRLEQMAVHSDEQDRVRKGLLERFDRHLLPFLGNDRFPERFIQTEFLQRSKKNNRGFPCLI